MLSRRLGAVPTESVTVFCLATAALSVLAHLALEQTVWPEAPLGWAAVLALGIGPVGAAFFTWDIGMKQGDIQLLGVASYAAPLLSTLALVLAGIAKPTWTHCLAAAADHRRGGAGGPRQRRKGLVTPGSGARFLPSASASASSVRRSSGHPSPGLRWACSTCSERVSCFLRSSARCEAIVMFVLL